MSIAEAAFNNCKKLKTIVFEGPVPSGLSSSYILKYATKVYYPEVYADEWRNYVASEQFAGFVDDYWTDVGMVALSSIEPRGAAFDGASQEVTISCATEGATVYYTIDGSEPSAANGRVYKGPFNIYDSVTVKAIAVKDDWKDSALAARRSLDFASRA